MRYHLTDIVFLMLLLILFGTTASYGQGTNVRNGEMSIKDVFGGASSLILAGRSGGNSNHPISIGQKIYPWYVYLDGTVTINIQGWDHFVTLAGQDDNRGNGDGIVSFVVDGKEVIEATAIKGNPVMIDIPLTGRNTLTISADYGANVRFIYPKLIKGNPTAFIEPEDLGILAKALRTKVDAVPNLKEKMDKGRIAIATFWPVDFPYTSVPGRTAEDLATVMVNEHFHPVERGDVDRLLLQLNIKKPDQITPGLAQKIAQYSGCHYILIGNIFDPGGNALVINARFIETATGKAVVAERMEVRKVAPVTITP